MTLKDRVIKFADTNGFCPGFCGLNNDTQVSEETMRRLLTTKLINLSNKELTDRTPVESKFIGEFNDI